LAAINEPQHMPSTNFPRPDKIYKYTTQETVEVILANMTLKFSKPSDFNDPFDCDVGLLDFKFNQQVNEYVKEEMVKIKEQYGLIQEFQRRSTEIEFWENLYKGAQTEKVASSRISCFSLANDTILMWSHYSDKHTGVCLEFDNNIKPRFLDLNEETDISEGVVGYSAGERINYLQEERFFGIYKLFFNKSESWIHEKEYRLVLLKNKGEYQKFSPSFLNAIYFGVKTNATQIKNLMALCKNNGLTHLKFFKSKKANLTVNFEQIKSWPE